LMIALQNALRFDQKACTLMRMEVLVGITLFDFFILKFNVG